ncbi:hypothetical protein [Kitasatospora sp. NPDC057015]|uniref:hypothetical protein n=1 Tax=Kitasatospora sp. NPDC057015 TaxID=3346001 RepID=UPI00362946F5
MWKTAPPNSSRVAAYLRCYPHDRWQMAPHFYALSRLAESMGFDEPVLFMDNGYRYEGRPPALNRLLDFVSAGRYRVLLIPGPFVFALDDRMARAVAIRFDSAGCRVLELASPRTRTNRGGPQPAPATGCR